MSDKPLKPNELDAEMARYEGEYLESADLMQSPPVTVTIKDIVPPNREKDAAGKVVKRTILEFEGAKKRMVAGKTNERILKAMFGKKASGWLGKQITIGVRYLKKAFGEVNVPTLRIIPPPGVPLPMQVREFFGAERPYES